MNPILIRTEVDRPDSASSRGADSNRSSDSNRRSNAGLEAMCSGALRARIRERASNQMWEPRVPAGTEAIQRHPDVWNRALLESIKEQPR